MAAERSLRRSLRESWQGRMDSMRQHLADVENTPGLSLLCLLGATTGALCGLVILALHTAIHLLQDPLFELFGVSGAGFTETSVAFRVAVPLLGALLLAAVALTTASQLDGKGYTPPPEDRARSASRVPPRAQAAPTRPQSAAWAAWRLAAAF